MQKIQTFSGSVTLGSTSKRVATFGVSDTTTTHYESHTNIINGKIATFLQSCGVDAVYEARTNSVDSSNKWLWIEGVPFLFIKAATSTGYFLLRYPGEGTNIWAVNANLFSAYNGTAYKFRLGFAGQAKNAWILRIGLYNATAFVQTYNLIFYHAKSIITGGPAIVYGDAPGSVTSWCNTNVRTAHIADGEYVKTLAELHEPNAPLQFHGGNYTGWKTAENGDYPLIPLTCGPYIIPGVYKTLGGMGLPQGNVATSDQQVESTIGGRKFLITSIDTPTTTYYNTGMIETT